MQIKYNEEDCSYTLTTNNRIVVRLSNAEMRQIEDYLRRNGWKSEIEEWIDDESDCYDFSEITREAFVEKCLLEIEYWWKCGNVDVLGPNTAHDITIDIAKDCKVWKG